MANRVRTQTVEVRQPAPNPTKLLTTTFDYDGAGNQTWVQDPLGKITTRTFNGSGQQVSTTDQLGHTSSVVINSFGETVKTVDETNIQTTATFDLAGRHVVCQYWCCPNLTR